MDLGFHGRVEKMILKGIVNEDFVNYKEPSFFILFPKCSFKCDLEAECQVCQNSELAKAKNINVSIDSVVKQYTENNITKAIVCGGLEPLDSMKDLLDLIKAFRKVTEDPIIIYTGYNESEVDKLLFAQFTNIIIKFGRFIPNRPHKHDEVLGVELSSDNQYAMKIS